MKIGQGSRGKYRLSQSHNNLKIFPPRRHVHRRTTFFQHSTYPPCLTLNNSPRRKAASVLRAFRFICLSSSSSHPSFPSLFFFSFIIPHLLMPNGFSYIDESSIPLSPIATDCMNFPFLRSHVLTLSCLVIAAGRCTSSFTLESRGTCRSRIACCKLYGFMSILCTMRRSVLSLVPLEMNHSPYPW